MDNTFHLWTNFALKLKSIIIPLLPKLITVDIIIIKLFIERHKPECDLCAKLHFDIINFVNTSDHQVDINICWSVNRAHNCRSNPSIIDLLIKDIIQDILLLKSLVGLLQPSGGHP